MAASPLPYYPDSQVPREMTRADMDAVIADFVQAVERGERAGFDMVELHAAHGYLLASFISPLTNKRTDEYGGSLENRLRFPLEVFRAMRKAWPDEQADVGPHLGDRLAGRRAHRRRRRRGGARLRRGRLRPDRRVDRADHAGRRADLRPHVPDAVLRPDPQRRRPRHHVRRRHHQRRPGQHHRAAGRADLVALARPHLVDPRSR